MTETEAKSQGAYEAWLDLLSRFSEEQRMQIANMLAHGWGVDGLRLEKDQAFKVFTPDAKHSKHWTKRAKRVIKTRP